MTTLYPEGSVDHAKPCGNSVYGMKEVEKWGRTTLNPQHPGKLLTVSIAAYNVAPYIERALASCLISNMDRLEVIVVNDGSADATSEIAHEYELKYPDVFRVIDKTNGGYGTTVNASLALASGKYFKLLDGDDWFDGAALDGLMEDLETSDADLVLSRFVNNEDGCSRVMSESWAAYAPCILDCEEDSLISLISISMWETAFRTSLARSYAPILPGKSLYTDQIFVSSLLAKVRKIQLTEHAVYHYRIGREGQSVAISSRARHCAENHSVIRECIKYMPDDRAPLFLRQCWKKRFCGYYSFFIKTLFTAPAKQGWPMLKSIEAELLATSRELYDACGEYSRKLIPALRRSGLLLYWPLKCFKIVERTQRIP